MRSTRVGEFGLGPNSTGKHFAESAEHAEQWGQWLNGDEGAVVELSVPRSFADQLMRWEKLDSIGPARFADPGQLDWLNRLMNGFDPTDPGNAVRVMQGNPNNPYLISQSPYVRWQQNGSAARCVRQQALLGQRSSGPCTGPGLQLHVGAVRMKRVVDELIEDALRELADEERQRTLWRAKGGLEVSSFVECASRLWDDSGLAIAIESGPLYDDEIDDGLRRLHATLRRVDLVQPVEILLEDPHLIAARGMARALLEELRRFGHDAAT